MFKRNKEATQVRVGFEVEKGIVRPPSVILDESGEQVGEVTSGTYSPYLKKGIGMGFIRKDLTEGWFTVLVRDKPHRVKLAKTPFIKQNYYK